MYTLIVQRILVVSFIAIVVVLVTGFILFNKPRTLKKSFQTLTPSPQKQEVNPPAGGKASFTIITDNTTRSFKAEKYHNKSPNVYIESVDPSVVHVKKIGITWDDFFKTLPMTLTKDCLITGDGETLCNGKGGTLIFYLNDVETPNLLDKEIKDGDKALIKFSPK